MNEFEDKYKEEVKKNNNLIKLNETLMKQADQLNDFATQVYELFCNQQAAEGHEFNKDQLAKLFKIIEKTLKNSQKCKTCQKRQSSRPAEQQCERWKSLYIKQTEQTCRLSELNRQLTEELESAQESRIEMEASAAKLVEDYLRIFKKLHSQVNQLKVAEAQRGYLEEQSHRQLTKDKSTGKKRDSSSKKPRKSKIVLDDTKKQEEMLRDALSELTSSHSQQLRDCEQSIKNLVGLLRQSQQTSLLARRSLRQSLLQN